MTGHGGARPGSGRRRKATARFRGETWIRLSMVSRVTINGHTLDFGRGAYWVDSQRYTDFTAAAAEFVRRMAQQ